MLQLLTKLAVGATAVTGTALTIGAVVLVTNEYHQSNGGDQQQSSASDESLSLVAHNGGGEYGGSNNQAAFAPQTGNNSGGGGGSFYMTNSEDEQEGHVTNSDPDTGLSGSASGWFQQRSNDNGGGMASLRQQGGSSNTPNCFQSLKQLEIELLSANGASTLYLCNNRMLQGNDGQKKITIDREVTIVCHEEGSPNANNGSSAGGGFRGTSSFFNGDPTQSLYEIQSKVTFQDCAFENLYHPFRVTNGGELILIDTLFQDNVGLDAGAITFDQGVGLEIKDSIFISNIGKSDVSAGAIRFEGTDDWDGYFHISNTFFDNNEGGWIGGVYLDKCEDVSIIGNAFSGNSCHKCNDCLVGMCLG